MLRNINASFAGKRILGTWNVGVSVADIIAQTATGDNGPGLLYDDALLPENAGKQLRCRILSYTGTSASLFVFENGSVLVSGEANGTYTLNYAVDADGVQVKTDSSSITVGPINTSVGLGTGTSTGSGSGGDPTAVKNASTDDGIGSSTGSGSGGAVSAAGSASAPEGTGTSTGSGSGGNASTVKNASTDAGIGSSTGSGTGGGATAEAGGSTSSSAGSGTSTGSGSGGVPSPITNATPSAGSGTSTGSGSGGTPSIQLPDASVPEGSGTSTGSGSGGRAFASGVNSLISDPNFFVSKSTSIETRIHLTGSALGPREACVVTLNFSSHLLEEETLESVTDVKIYSSYQKEDVPVMELNGLSELDVSKKMVLVPVKHGTLNTDYSIEVVCPTSNEKKILSMVAQVPVRLT